MPGLYGLAVGRNGEVDAVAARERRVLYDPEVVGEGSELERVAPVVDHLDGRSRRLRLKGDRHRPCLGHQAEPAVGVRRQRAARIDHHDVWRQQVGRMLNPRSVADQRDAPLRSRGDLSGEAGTGHAPRDTIPPLAGVLETKGGSSGFGVHLTARSARASPARQATKARLSFPLQSGRCFRRISGSSCGESDKSIPSRRRANLTVS